MECYTFTFGYDPSAGQDSHEVNLLALSPDTQLAFFVGDALSSFNSAIKGLLKAIRDLPKLPRE
jgi:hypothetical protein